jgi:hypothetical protein
LVVPSALASSCSLTGVGDAGSPFLVGSAEDLAQVGVVCGLDKHYEQTANIDLPAPDGDSNHTPIGTQSAPFAGVYDGQGYTINGLVLGNANADWVGLFGATAVTSVLRDVHLANIEVRGDYLVGGLVGEHFGLIEDSSVVGGVVIGEETVGGLVAQNSRDPDNATTDFGRIVRSSAWVTVTMNYEEGAVGGLVGLHQGRIVESLARGDVTSTDEDDDDEIDGVGGLVGLLDEGEIWDSYATGNVIGAKKVGGLVGRVSSGSIERSYASGTVTGTDSNSTGGLVGVNDDNSGSNVKDSFWDEDLTGLTVSAGGTKKSTEDMLKRATYTDANWLVAGAPASDPPVWAICVGVLRPFLLWEPYADLLLDASCDRAVASVSQIGEGDADVEVVIVEGDEDTVCIWFEGQLAECQGLGIPLSFLGLSWEFLYGAFGEGTLSIRVYEGSVDPSNLPTASTPTLGQADILILGPAPEPQAGLAPGFGAVTSTVDGFTVPLSNFDADFTWAVTVTAGAASIAAGVLTVSGLGAGVEATATVTTTRDGYAGGSASVTGSALEAVAPVERSFVAPGGVVPSLPVGSGEWVREDGSRVPLTVSSPGEGQVRYETEDGVRVTFTGAPGTDAASGLVADPAGEIVCEVCVALAAGGVIDAWMFSVPRLVGSFDVADLPCQQFSVSVVDPVDGGGPVSGGAHTLQLALPTAAGVQALNVGVMVGGPVPTVVPSGEGPAPVGLLALGLAAVAAGAIAARRRGVAGGVQAG